MKTRSTALLCASALFSTTLTVAAAMTTPAQAASWHPGWCAQDEGLSVVVDYGGIDDPSVPSEGWDARCLVGGVVEAGASTTYIAAMEAVGFDVTASGTYVEGIDDVFEYDHGMSWWMFSGAKVPGAWDQNMYGIVSTGTNLNVAIGARYQVDFGDSTPRPAPQFSEAETPVVEGPGTDAPEAEAPTVEAPAPLVMGSASTIRGTAKVGKKLTAKTGTWTAGTQVSHQWLRDGTPISGATRTTRTLTAADKGHRISVRTTGTKPGHTASSTVSSSVKVTAGTLRSVRPKVSGKAVQGRKLTAKVGAWGPGKVTLTYRWLRNGKAIPRATGRTYTLKAKDRGTRVSVKVTGSRKGYAPTSRTSAKTTKVRR
ncbi:hypothetical protein [Nocardioides yefusunii]|uniref:Ig-like domain-containing protein n=1 Tax=Nocardioides yefusunii TaxID=2500546 RepID=A0ABW1QUM3_9ACTN|nr:hypothetical protein [Nocardioides yefusunii]